MPSRSSRARTSALTGSTRSYPATRRSGWAVTHATTPPSTSPSVSATSSTSRRTGRPPTMDAGTDVPRHHLETGQVRATAGRVRARPSFRARGAERMDQRRRWRVTYATASRRLWTPSFPRMFWTWLRTVVGLTRSRSAIVRVFAPLAIRRRISSSRRVSAGGGAASGAYGRLGLGEALSHQGLDLLRRRDIAEQMQGARRVRPCAGDDEDADVEPDRLPCLGPGRHGDVLDRLLLLDERENVTSPIAQPVSWGVTLYEDLAAQAAHDLSGGVPQDLLR